MLYGEILPIEGEQKGRRRGSEEEYRKKGTERRTREGVPERKGTKPIKKLRMSRGRKEKMWGDYRKALRANEDLEGETSLPI